MHTAIKPEVFTQTVKVAPTKTQQIYVLELFDGRIAIGSSTHPATRIRNINAGACRAIPKSLPIRRIVGIKEVTETRTLPSVVAQFCRDFGEDKIVCV